jgi:hypothetical protein
MQALQSIENRIDALMQGPFPSDEHEEKLLAVQMKLERMMGEDNKWITDSGYDDGIRYYHFDSDGFRDMEITVDKDLVYKVSNTDGERKRGDIITSKDGENEFWSVVSELLDE